MSMNDDGTITFIANHVPPLPDDSYTLQVTHHLQGGADRTFQKTYKFVVRGGARFTLTPDQIYKVFPPPDMLGDYDSLLPHVVFERRTLPWERTAKSGPTRSWLALLVFAESEAPTPHIGTIADLSSPPDGTYSYGSVSEFALETGEKSADACVWLDLPASVFAAYAPSLNDLQWNAHARLRTDDASSTDYAVVVANRVPPAGQTAVVHLVSLEGLGDVLPQDDGTFSSHPPWSTVRLASLKSWRFQVVPLQASFVHLLEALNRDVAANGQSTSRDSQLRLSKDHRPAVAPVGAPAAPFDAGYTVLAAPDGSSPTWYRGPFVPSTVTPPAADDTWADASLPADHAAALDVSVRTTPAKDCTYAAAWQLGRLLALADKGFATAQVAWKRDCRLQLNQAIRQAAQGPSASRADDSSRMRGVLASASAIRGYLGRSLTTTPGTPSALLIPQPLVDWLGQLALLKSVPFNYLVPDADMLPAESLRFFRVDPRWLACLLDGAWSLEREPAAVWAFDAAYQPWKQLQAGSLCPSFATGASWPVSGILMSSRLVSGYWPNICFKTSTSARLLREDRLGPSTLLALFDGTFQTLTIQEPPEGIHFGFDMDDQGDLSKAHLRDASGNATSRSLSAIPQRGGRRGVIQLDQLATRLKDALSGQFSDFTPAEFALELVEGVPGATFTLPG
jgi:hypothetical protein